ncbi:MAG TPA: Crp/Fnr family transcriptional regulator [Terracidiphilus sp.]|jgi:CRP-like cAMP-binding protein|nr:Crp/Fnr family transcriptional regulator [Terracidiphilus sp.]
MAEKHSNLLLDSLPTTQRKALLARMEPIALPIGTVLYRSGEQPEYAHFMTEGIASIVTFMADGVGAEVGLIGREGVVEAINLLGSASPPTTAFIQVEGAALRIRYAELQKVMFSASTLLRRILEFAQCHGFILSQLAACNGLHEIEERLARWLLMVEDRVQSDKFYLTQEFLAEMLGIRRTSVSAAAGSLQRSGLIAYRRGHIRVLKRKGLEEAACECYPIVRDLAAHLNR